MLIQKTRLGYALQMDDEKIDGIEYHTKAESRRILVAENKRAGFNVHGLANDAGEYITEVPPEFANKKELEAIEKFYPGWLEKSYWPKAED